MFYKLLKSKMICTIFLLLISNSIFAQKVVTKYIEKYKPLVVKLSQEYNIPYAIIFGIAITEGGAGTSRNCKLLKNHFGIVGKNNLSKIGKFSKFKQYDSDEESFIDFCKKISKKQYFSKIKSEKDFNKWLLIMSKAGYSEFPQVWIDNVTLCIKTYKLHKPVLEDYKYELQQVDTSVHTNNN